jgi:hypothetical protein
MLRTAIVLIGLVLLVAGFVAAMSAACTGPGIMSGVFGALILCGTLFERIRYKPLNDRSPGPGWTDTGERFFDPETSELVAVYSRDRDGERLYVRMPRGQT